MFFLLGAFLDAISGTGFDYVASGHYANVIHPSANQIDEPSVLELSQDMVTIWDILLWLQDLICTYGLEVNFCTSSSFEESSLINLC